MGLEGGAVPGCRGQEEMEAGAGCQRVPKEAKGKAVEESVEGLGEGEGVRGRQEDEEDGECVRS